jgi:hypothetical protein
MSAGATETVSLAFVLHPSRSCDWRGTAWTSYSPISSRGSSLLMANADCFDDVLSITGMLCCYLHQGASSLTSNLSQIWYIRGAAIIDTATPNITLSMPSTLPRLGSRSTLETALVACLVIDRAKSP